MLHLLVDSAYEVFYYLCNQRVTQTSKAMQTTAIRTVAYSLPENEVILLTLLISTRYILYTDLRKISHPDSLQIGPVLGESPQF